MQFEPGPIPLLAPDPATLAPEQPQFQALTADIFTGLDPIEIDLDGALGELAAFDVPGEFDTIDLQTATVDEALLELSAFSTDVHIQSAQDGIDSTAGQFQQAVSAAPADIWQPVPAPLNSTGPTGPFPGVNGPTTIAIQNLTAPGDALWYSGDSFVITIQVDGLGGQYDFANKALQLTRMLNGADIGPLDLGSTDNFGRLVYSSSWNDASIGDRVFGVDPPGYSTNPTLTLTVLPGPRPGSSGPGAGAGLSVTLNNLSTGDSSTLHVNDVWNEVITGTPGQPVYIDQIKDGVDQGELFIGSTDATGSLTIGGTITAAQLGSYTETFRVGSQAVPTQLTFAVVP